MVVHTRTQSMPPLVDETTVDDVMRWMKGRREAS
jgi:hypothetical protein